MSKVYYPEYDGYYRMLWHDREENALKRWFENFKQEKDSSFASDFEWLVVEEIPFRRRMRYICTIGDDGRGTSREVAMDYNAPPAPVLTFAAKRKWEPPPQKTQAQIRQEEEWRRAGALYRALYPSWREEWREGKSGGGFINAGLITSMRPPSVDVPVKSTPPVIKHRRNT